VRIRKELAAGGSLQRSLAVLGNVEAEKRAAEMLREEIEFMGPVRIRDVEEAQQKIVAIIRRLEESGEIIVSRGKGEDILV